jgi:hypothetical protein
MPSLYFGLKVSAYKRLESIAILLHQQRDVVVVLYGSKLSACWRLESTALLLDQHKDVVIVFRASCILPIRGWNPKIRVDVDFHNYSMSGREVPGPIFGALTSQEAENTRPKTWITLLRGSKKYITSVRVSRTGA